MNANGVLTKKCPVCDSVVKQKDVKIQADLYICNNCTLQYIENIVAIAENSETLHPTLGVVTSVRVENFTLILEQLSKVLTSGAYGLEIGSGIGVFMELAQKAGYKMKGIEPIDTFYSISKNKGLDVVHGFFPDDLHIEDKFDFIIFNDVFEHIPDCKRAVQSVCNYLKDGGILIINIPVTSGIIYKMSYLFHRLDGSRVLRRLWQIDTVTRHMFYFNEKSLTHLVGRYDFEQIAKIDMKTITKNGLKERIDLIPMGGGLSMLIYLFLRVALPFFHFFPHDTQCFVYKHRER